VAFGGDESIDLSDEQRGAATERSKASGGKLKVASIYRSMRPSTHGLLLLYPIIPAIPEAAAEGGNIDEAYLWESRDPLIGIGVSLPGSLHDNGCDYVCTKQKIREIFGEISDDLERDDYERDDKHPAKLYDSLLGIMGLGRRGIPEVVEDPISMPYKVV